VFNKLFQRNTNGSVQEWQIFVSGNSFYTVSGKKDGKLVESSPTTCEGKNIGKANETTPEQQCMLEAQAKYKKKLESGYRETLEGIDSTGLLEPMLAKEYKNYFAKLQFPVISSPKLDGVRVNATKAGLFSRNGKPFISVPHIQKALEPFFEKFPDYVLDGELYNPEYKDNFDKIISLVRRQKPTTEDLKESQDKIQFWIFDTFSLDGREKLTSHERKQFVKWTCDDLSAECVVALEYTVCNTQEELDAKYGEYLEAGVEGQMINSSTAMYQHKRTQDLLKRKEFQDEEFEVLDIISGTGNREGCGKLICKISDDTFDCSVKGNVEYLQELLLNKHLYIGKMATVKFQNYTPHGKPRFPIATNIDRGNYE